MIQLVSDEYSVTIRKAEPQETVDLERLYSAVAVTEKNIREKLTEGPKSFGSRGGIFHPLDAAYLLAQMQFPQERLLVAERNGDIGGLLWYGLWEPGLYSDVKPLPGSEELVKLVAREGSRGNMGYSKDIIATDSIASGVSCFGMFYEMMLDYVASGVAYTCGEVYKVDGWDDGSGYRTLNMINQASYRFLSASGGVNIGDAPQKVMEIGRNKVWITPKVFLWDTASTAEIIAKQPEKKKWRISNIWKPESK